MNLADQITTQGPEPTILVVDDNKGVLEFLLLLLSKHGLSVIGASSGNQCLNIVKTRPVSLIILDVMMPAMDGLEELPGAQKDLFSSSNYLLTARDDMATRAAAMDLGVSEFVAKPSTTGTYSIGFGCNYEIQEWDKTADQAFWRIEKSTRGAGPKAIGILSTISTPELTLVCRFRRQLWKLLTISRMPRDSFKLNLIAHRGRPPSGKSTAYISRTHLKTLPPSRCPLGLPVARRGF